MDRYFNPDRPVFVIDRHTPFVSNGKTYKYGSLWPWKETNVDIESAKTLFDIMLVNHVPEWEKALNFASPTTLTQENLETLVKRVNQKIKETVPSDALFAQKKIKHSKVRERQESLLRSWRNTNDKWEDLSTYYDKTLEELYQSQGDK